MTRKEFNRFLLLLGGGSIVSPTLKAFPINTFVSQRPPLAQRKFKSGSVEKLITEIKANCKDEELGWLFENCFPNTLDTTVFFEMKDGLPDTYVITGDIDAMWLRDSSAQVNPYLPLCAEDKPLSLMIEGLIRRQTQCILLDPFANAFYKDSNRKSGWRTDKTEMKPGVHERKWELDSLCYCIRLAHQYWKVTGNSAMFDSTWESAMQLAIDTMKEQQRKTGKGNYHFQRKHVRHTDTQAGGGYGHPWKPTGMICSAFRNSDDATAYLFNIPENLFAVVSLRQLAEILSALKTNNTLAQECLNLANEVEQAVQAHGIVNHEKFGKIYVYECDGLGHSVLIEDAGIPGLVTIPYLGYGRVEEELYQRSRKFALSDSNPYFYSSAIAEGNGSPHTETKGEMIWHIGIVARAMTSIDEHEIRKCLQMLKATHAGKGFMHESFKKDNPQNFTRHWFAWANSLFGEMLWKVYRERPSMLKL
jgi:meiotically up-regulated gene 157 (Mug157) protein